MGDVRKARRSQSQAFVDESARLPVVSVALLFALRRWGRPRRGPRATPFVAATCASRRVCYSALLSVCAPERAFVQALTAFNGAAL